MKIIRELQPRDTIEAFAEKHGLTMSVVEVCLMASATATQFRARFTELGRDATSGSGSTEDEAIEDYARRLSRTEIVVNGSLIRVPILRYGALDLARIHEARGDKKKPMLTTEE